MPTLEDYKDFNAVEVNLEGSNLIEASAGTGKTYSIAILALRLILEKQIKIKEILMVTFTKAAVAELQGRIRLFTRQAYKASCGEKISDPTIAKIVTTAQGKLGHDEVKDLLNEAVLFLDETSVLTIHGFCQQTLTEFAFETDQLFGAETLQETTSIIEEQVNAFWREEVTTIPAGLLGPLIDAGLSRNGLVTAVQHHLDGKRFLHFNDETDYRMSAEDHSWHLEFVQTLQDNESGARLTLHVHISDNSARLAALCESNRYAKAALPLLNDPPSFLGFLWDKKGTVYAQTLFGDLLIQLEECEAIANQKHERINELLISLQCSAIKRLSKSVREYKQRNNLLSFDDMIQKLHHSLVRKNNTELIKALQKKYKAVFIDEFQDTDRLQYDIFEKAFGKDTILFYIGDPKQSIYAWRRADIFTYFKACSAVNHLYGMNDNYRSSERFIGAMNAFFLPDADFDTFYFQGAPKAIKYHPVSYPAARKQSDMTRSREPVSPMTVFHLENKNNICNALTGQLIELLEGDTYLIGPSEARRTIKPSDIGILVRTKNEGRSIKSTLASYGIPAVTIDDAKILQSEEAAYLSYILEAIVDNSSNSIHKALLSPFTGFESKDILSLDDELTNGLFRKYKITWETDGIYNALVAFISDFSVKKVLLQNNAEFGERIIANLFQLIEMLHKVQSEKQYSPEELINWLKRGIEGMENEGDEFEQRIESDEESVKIVTIHKSKGLEYPIVFAPFLDFLTFNKFDFVSFRHQETGEYVGASKATLSDEHQGWLKEQLEQENRRLLYVAISRAVYKCFIFKNTSNRGEYNYTKSTLAVFLNAQRQTNTPLIEFTEAPAIPEGYYYGNAVRWQPNVDARPVDFNVLQVNWTKLSYTRLAAKREYLLKPLSAELDNEYDLFVFKQLAKGQKTGNMLHCILENIQFNDSSRWQPVIADAIARFYPGQAALYQPRLYDLVRHVLDVPIQINGTTIQLSSITREKCIHEFEFDFNVSLFNPDSLAELATEEMGIYIQGAGQLEGIMNGKIDLFFEHEGKYYLLDWKSNFLGDSS